MIEKLIRGFLIFGALYFTFDALLHLSNIKLSTVKDYWPESAIKYSNLINYIYASFVLLAASISLIIQSNIKKYQSILAISSIWASFHGIVLLFLVWMNNYQVIFQNTPSLLVWLPFYGEYLSFNSLLLFVYSGLVFCLLRKKND